MNKKAFTLIELMAVIVVLGIVALIAVPVISGTLKDSKEKIYEEQVRRIEDAAKKWGVDNIYDDNENEYYVSLSELISEGYLEGANQIKNPIDNTTMDGCVIISYEQDYNQYTYEYEEENCE